MAKVEVLRVENQFGDGPYTSAAWMDAPKLSAAHSNGDHPSPWERGEPWDAINYIPMNNRVEQRTPRAEFCGFLFIDQFLHWFCPEWRERMAVAGFQLVVYEVDEEEVFLGNRQITFLKHRASKTTTLPLSPKPKSQTEPAWVAKAKEQLGFFS